MPRRRPRSPRWRFAFGAALALFAAWWWLARGDRQYWPREQILDAIRFVESSGRDQPPDGDGGLAIGPFQIHRVYWLDAFAFQPDLAGDYQDCCRRAYAERVVAAYMQKWAPDAWSRGDAERIARVHNGGPRGHLNPNTLPYWHKVRARLP
jgi:hypothetical protein